MTKPNLIFNVHAITEIERVTGLPCWKLCQELPPAVRIIVAILWGGMLHDKPDAAIADAENIVEEIGAPSASRLVLQPFTDAIYRLALGTGNAKSDKLN